MVGVSEKTLTWDPPTQYTDNSALNPASDLDHYEIYVKQENRFSDSDMYTDTVPAYNTAYNLALLLMPSQPPQSYYVSVRAVTTSGVKSDFSSSARFSF